MSRGGLSLEAQAPVRRNPASLIGSFVAASGIVMSAEGACCVARASRSASVIMAASVSVARGAGH